jgi:hypothetical protein
MAFKSTRTAISASLLLLTAFTFLPLSLAAADSSQTITYQNADGTALYLQDDRRPALYTGNFGDCLGGSRSLITVTNFDARYYKDNMTITFDIQGYTNLTKEALMSEFAWIVNG